MKDSGIEWIGEIPEGWEIHRIKTHFSIISGSGFKPELQGQSTGDFPVCKASDISSSGHYLHTSANYISSDIVKSQHFSIIPKGSILFAKIGEAMRKNNRSLCSLDCCVDNNCQGLVPKNISSEFSYYLFTCIDMTWFDNAGTIPCINNQKLYDCRIPFPSYDEQLLIANHLNIQCDKINEMLFHIRASIEEYKKLKQAVITQAVTKGVRGEREMKDSGVEWIGEINHRFSLIKLKYICSILDQYRKPISADKRSQSGSVLYDYYGASGAIDKIDDYTIDDHVMLIGEDGANLRMRNLPLMYEVNGKAWINNHAHILKPTERVDFYYLFYALEELDINPYITGSAQPKLSQEKLQNIWVPLPDLEEQQEIATYIRSKCVEIDKLIAKKEQLVKELESYKKSLIYEVVTGKREV